MGGMFGVVSEGDCIDDLFYGVDYHSHLGTQIGGMATKHPVKGFIPPVIHDITATPFRTKFEPDLEKFCGSTSGIGLISDFDAQPRIIESHLGLYAITTVGVIKNSDELKREAFRRRNAHFSDRTRGEVNPTELVATLINQEDSFVGGIEYAQNAIRGSCSILLLTDGGIYASRDKLGRTPLVIGKRVNGSVTLRGKKIELPNACAVTSESCALQNQGFKVERELGPGEVVLIQSGGVEQKKKPNEQMQVCSFLWVYYGYPSSGYQGRNVEEVRYRCGAALAEADRKDRESGKLKIDMVAGIPDSGTSHAIGYANKSGVPFMRPFVKYTPTWPRSFMPQEQGIRDLVAQKKLMLIEHLIRGKSILFCEDSIVRGTQLRDNVDILFELGAREVHMRPACPPLVYGCAYLNFSRSRSVRDLAGVRAIAALEDLGEDQPVPLEMVRKYAEGTPNFQRVVDWIRDDLHLTTLRYQRLSDLVAAIGLPKKDLCTHCWDGSGHD